MCRGVQGVYGREVLGGVYGGCLGCVLGEEEGGEECLKRGEMSGFTPC